MTEKIVCWSSHNLAHLALYLFWHFFVISLQRWVFLGRTVGQAMTFSGRYTRSPFIKLDHYSDRLEHIRTYDDSTICREWTEKKRLILLMETAITMVKLLTALIQFCSLRPAHNIGLHLLDRTHAICVFVF